MKSAYNIENIIRLEKCNKELKEHVKLLNSELNRYIAKYNKLRGR